MTYYIIGVICMAVFSYLPRFIPLTFYRKKIRSPLIRSMLYYLPYAALGALTFPGIFSATPHLAESLAGGAVAIFFAYRHKGLVFVALAAMLACYAAYVLITFIR